MNRLRIGVIGLGMVGSEQVATIARSVALGELVAVSDFDLDRAHAIAEGLPGDVRVARSAEELIASDDLARRLVIARGDGIAHQKLLNELSQTDLLILDDFLTVGIDSDAASDLFAILANREHRLPTVIASQTGPSHWVTELPDRVAADSIVNRLANHARTINLGQIDMRRLRHDHARTEETYWE